jgi:hypothetical protein
MKTLQELELAVMRVPWKLAAYLHHITASSTVKELNKDFNGKIYLFVSVSYL